MKQQWIQHAAQPASEVRVFALGWAQDVAWWASAMTEAAAGSADVLLLYAWHVPGDAPKERIASYPRRCLNAWSFGVWSAARYLSGIAAGMKTETNKLGYVAAWPDNAEINGGINAFTLGAQSVNPDA